MAVGMPEVPTLSFVVRFVCRKSLPQQGKRFTTASEIGVRIRGASCRFVKRNNEAAGVMPINQC
jgi:hypothetical protein